MVKEGAMYMEDTLQELRQRMASHHFPLVREERNAIVHASFFQHITIRLHIPQDNGAVFPAMSLFLAICQNHTTYRIGFPLSIVGIHHSQ